MSISIIKKTVILGAVASALTILPSLAQSESGGFVWLGGSSESGGPWNSGAHNDNASLWGLGSRSESGGATNTGGSSESGGVASVGASNESGNSREGESDAGMEPLNIVVPKTYVKTYKW